MKEFTLANEPSLKTINECRREGRKQKKPGHSKGKPVVSSKTTNINVRFAALLPVEIEIRRMDKASKQKNGAMPVSPKTSVLTTATMKLMNMKKSIPVLLVLVAATLVGCQKRQPVTPEVAVTNIASIGSVQDHATITNALPSLAVPTNSMSPNNPAVTNASN